MSQVGVSRPSTGMSVGGKPGLNLPEIKHPLSRLGDPGTMGIRGVSRASDRPLSHAGSVSGRPLANERTFSPRKSISAGGRYSKLNKSTPMPPLQYEAIPEGVEVMQGDASKTRLPVFGNRADVADREELQSRVSSRLSRASVQSRLEIDELEMLLRKKAKGAFYEIRKRFKDNDPEQKGNVTREALARIVISLIQRPISQSHFNKLMDRMGYKDKQIVSYTEFCSLFRETDSSEYPRWMDPVQRHYQDKVVMGADEVHINLKEKAKQRFLDLAELIPQCNPGGSGRIMKHEFRNMLNKNLFFMDDAEFDKLWRMYDEGDTGIIAGETLMNRLGISLRSGTGKLQPIHESNRENKENALPTSGSRRYEIERQKSLDVEKWLKNKFREGFRSMKEKFEHFDADKKGIVNFDHFLDVLAENGLHLEKSYLNKFFARCQLSVSKEGVPYYDFLHKFQDRSEAGMPHNILTDPKHRYNTSRSGSPGAKSSTSIIEAQMMNMFQRDFLSLLGIFHKIDKYGTDLISQEEFRAAIESRFSLAMTDDQFRGLIDRVPLNRDGLVKYADFMAQFDTKGKAKSLFEEREQHVPVAVRTPSPLEMLQEGEEAMDLDVPAPERIVIHQDELVEDFPNHRPTLVLFGAIKDLLKRRFQDVERAFYDIDEYNSGKLTQDMMYNLLKRFDFHPEISRGEIRDLWDTFITNQNNSLEYHQFIRHFGYSLRSAAFPNAKVCPPKKGDSDMMMRSRKLNAASDMLQDNVRAKIEYLWDDLRQEFLGMDPHRTGFVEIDTFRDILIDLNIHLSDYELNKLSRQFDLKKDGRISYIELLKPYAIKRQTWRHGNNMLSLLTHPAPELPIGDIVEPPQKGLYGITAKLRQKLAGDWKTLRRAFKKLDQANVGYLSLPEFRTVLRLANVLLDEEEVYHVMTEFDEGMTGKISYDRFLNTMTPNTRQSQRVNLGPTKQ
ncbi:EF-hand calcium-binding domain-containing protein 6-like isoform X2 [Lineus longissimus]|uniref:EF-hand calcium-binding domain-containing protein 6-like isoform X2 n=1 Tax=Lineus longissimus TaxID=88925 RepID=UPI002B4D99AF